jgi:hypothetical protein
MSKKVVLVGAMAAALMVVVGPGTASANIMWCGSDPPIQVVTPGGQNLMVNNMIYVSPQDKDSVKLITHDASTAPDGSGGTLITVHIYFPDNFNDAYVVSSNNRFDVHDSGGTNGGGNGSNVVTLRLHVPIR